MDDETLCADGCEYYYFIGHGLWGCSYRGESGCINKSSADEEDEDGEDKLNE